MGLATASSSALNSALARAVPRLGSPPRVRLRPASLDALDSAIRGSGAGRSAKVPKPLLTTGTFSTRVVERRPSAPSISRSAPHSAPQSSPAVAGHGHGRGNSNCAQRVLEAYPSRRRRLAPVPVAPCFRPTAQRMWLRLAGDTFPLRRFGASLIRCPSQTGF